MGRDFDAVNRIGQERSSLNQVVHRMGCEIAVGATKNGGSSIRRQFRLVKQRSQRYAACGDDIPEAADAVQGDLPFNQWIFH